MGKRKSIRLTFLAVVFLTLGSLTSYRQISGNISYYQTCQNISPILLLCAVRDLGFIISGAGILYLKNWARRLGILLSVINLFQSFYTLAFYFSSSPQAQLKQSYGKSIYIVIIANSLIFYFLTRPKIKDYFK